MGREQRYLQYIAWFLAGLLALGTLVGAINDSLDLITPTVTYVGTILIVVGWFGLQLYLRHHGVEWRFEGAETPNRMRRLNIGYVLPILGMIALLWIPRLLTLPAFSAKHFEPAREGEVLIVIATFYVGRGAVDIEAHRQIQDKLLEQADLMELDNVRVEIEPTVLTSDEREEAERLGELYDANMIIWGEDVGIEVIVNFLNLNNPSALAAEVTIEEQLATQLADPPAYAQFMLFDLPEELTFYTFYALGQAYYDEGVYKEAIILVETAVTSVEKTQREISELSSAYFYLGWLYHITNGDYAMVVDIFTQAITLDPQDAKAYNNRGIAYVEQGEIETAIEDFTQAIILDPQLASVYNNRGNAYTKLGEIETAIEDYSQAIILDPQDVNAYYNRGLAYFEQGEFEIAIEDFTQAITLDPQDAEAYYFRGIAYGDFGEFETAIEDFTQAIALNPQFAHAFGVRGLARREIGDLTEALPDFQQYLILKPNASDRAMFEGWIAEIEAELDRAGSE